jgi:RimJ/RimL family protein N-acetyltransferase
MISLRDLISDDLDLLVKWRNDPVVNCHLADRLKTREEAEAWFHRLRANPKTWLKAILADGAVVGYAAVESVDEKNRKCELAMVIGDANSWGGGVGRHVFGEMLRYSFAELHMHRVFAAVCRGNDRSERLVRRAGFVPEGTMRESILIAGQFTDLLCFSLLETEYHP